MEDLRYEKGKAPMATIYIGNPGKVFLVERGKLYLDLDIIDSIDLFYEDGDSFHMIYEKASPDTILYQERFEDSSRNICSKCGEELDNGIDHSTCVNNVGDLEYIREVINNVAINNKNDDNVKILISINGDTTNLIKVM